MSIKLFNYVISDYLVLIINDSRGKIIHGQKTVIVPTFDHYILTQS